MRGDGKDRTVEVSNGMALFATILVRFARKLFVVRILVAIEASREFHLVNCTFAGGQVTFRAFHFGMHPLQRIFRCCMVLDAEHGWPPAVY